MRVLLVEDETLVRRFIRGLIPWEEEGYTIVGEATNGEEALKLLRSEDAEIDIVLTDIRMPLLDGFGLIEAINEAGFGCEVVILSSYDDFEYVRTALQLQVTDYVHKATMTSGELLACLHKARAAWVKKQEARLAEDWAGHTNKSRRTAVRARLLTMALEEESNVGRAEMLSRQLDCWSRPFHACMGIRHGDIPEEAEEDAVLFEYGDVWLLAGDGDIVERAAGRLLQPSATTGKAVTLREWPQAYEGLKLSLDRQLEDRDIPLAYHALVRQAIRYIREQYTDELTLEALSGQVHVSPSYFSRLFQKETGKTFTEYLTGIRLQQARRLLLDTDHPVYDVAEKSGYRNARYFLKLFKETYGMTPTEYRSEQKLTE